MRPHMGQNVKMALLESNRDAGPTDANPRQKLDRSHTVEQHGNFSKKLYRKAL